MRNIIGKVVASIGIILGVYVGGWLMFIKPILDICYAIDNNNISAMIIGVAIIKCLLASFIGIIIGYVGVLVGLVISEN